MADAFRGLTIKLGADARPVTSAINSITSAASQAQAPLNRLNRALKFDKGNAGALGSAIDLVGDKAKLTARELRTVNTAMEQAGNEALAFKRATSLSGKTVKEIANDTKQVYSATQRLRSEYNHVDAELQVINDAVRSLVAAQKGITFKKAQREVTELQKAMSGTGREADSARQKMESLIRAATRQGDLGKQFGLGADLPSANHMVRIFDNLRENHSAFAHDLEQMKKAEGYSALSNRAEALSAELRQSATEAARLNSELYMHGATEGLSQATTRLRAMDAAADSAIASGKAMSAAYRAMPTNIDAARAKLIAFRTEESAVQTKMEAITAKMKELENVAGFDKSLAESGDVFTKFANVSKEFVDLKVKCDEADVAVEKLERDLKELERVSNGDKDEEIKKLSNELEEASTRASELRGKLAAVDSELKGVAASKGWRMGREELMKYNAEVDRMNASVSPSRILGSIGSSIRTMGYGLYSTITPAVMIAGRYAIQAANDIDSAYRDMRKTVNGTEEDFEHLRKAALEFSTTHVTSADTILEIEAMGGQLGIAAQNLEGFSNVVSNLDIATDIDAESLAQYVGQLSNIMDDISAHKNDPEEYQQKITSFSDALVRLGNNSAAQESSIMKVMMRIASMGNISDMTTPQLLAISTAIAATGQGCEAAGTAISKTFSDIESAVSSGGEELDSFAAVAGQSAAEFAQSWTQTPVDAFTAFIAGLKRIDEEGGSVDGTLKELDINSVRQKQALMGLTNTLDVLYEALGMSQDAWSGLSTVMADGSVEKAGDAAREAQRKSEGFSGELQMMKNNAAALANEMAVGATPIIGFLGDAFHGLTDAAGDVPSSLKTITVGLLGLVASLGPISVGIGSITDGLTSLKEAGEKISQISTMSKATRLEYAELASSLNVVRSNQAAYIAQNGAASAAIRSQEQALIKQQEALKKTASAASIAGKALSAIGVGFAAAATIYAIAAVSEKMAENAKRAAIVKEGSEKVSKAFSGLKGASDVASIGVQNIAGSMGKSKMSFDEYRQLMDQSAQSYVDFADAVQERKIGAEGDAYQAQVYADIINELAGNCDGSADKIALLQDAVDNFNELTGSSLGIVDGYTGRINAEKDAVEALTRAFKENVMAQAYKDIVSDTAKQLASKQMERNATQGQYESAKKAAEEYARTVTGPWTESNTAQQDYLNSQVDKYKNDLATIDEEIGKLEDGLENAAAGQRECEEAAKETQEQYKAMLRNVDGFRSALEAAGRSGSELDNAFSFATNNGPFEGSIEDFVQQCNLAGIGAEQFAAVGADAFKNFYVQAKYDLSKTAQAINIVERTGISPKHLVIDDDGTIKLNKDGLNEIDLVELAAKGYEVTDNGTIKAIQDGIDALALADLAVKYFTVDDDGSIKVAMDKLSEVDRQALKDKGFEVTDDGTIKVNLEKLTDLDRQILLRKGLVVTDDGTIEIVRQDLSNLNGMTVSPSVDLTTTLFYRKLAEAQARFQQFGNLTSTGPVLVGAQAAGGINMRTIRAVPAFATGAAINGIVTGPTLTNQGLVGEAGAEAILRMGGRSAVVPLSNRHYVAPFARAVAAEMPSTGSVTTTTNTYQIYLDGQFVAGGVNESTTLGELARGLKIKAES